MTFGVTEVTEIQAISCEKKKIHILTRNIYTRPRQT